VSPAELCGVLLVGSVAAGEVPELSGDETLAEVRRRLAEAGCELAYAAESDRWVARLAGPLPELESHQPVLRLDQAELAVLAACWLHLRFLPAELARAAGTGREPGEGAPGAGLDLDDLVGEFRGRLDREQVAELVDRLERNGFLVGREGRYLAGPLLATLEDASAGEQARALLTRHGRLGHLRRRAVELRADGDQHAAD
jgi:hypothetical protein